MEKEWDTVRIFLQTIPKRHVTTYAAVALACGISNPRHVGRILQQNTDARRVPCFRVVRSNGTLAAGYKFGERRAQMARLKKDGVVFDARGRVNLSLCMFHPRLLRKKAARSRAL